jgi:hypothetical protein
LPSAGNDLADELNDILGLTRRAASPFLMIEPLARRRIVVESGIAGHCPGVRGGIRMAQHEFMSDDATPLDALVGGFEDVRKEPPIAEDPAVLRVPVFVKGISDADGMGLADDVRLLLDAFVRDPDSVEREAGATTRAPDADPEEDVSIALHGLSLGPENERELHRLIRGLVAERRAPEGRER